MLDVKRKSYGDTLKTSFAIATVVLQHRQKDSRENSSAADPAPAPSGIPGIVLQYRYHAAVHVQDSATTQVQLTRLPPLNQVASGKKARRMLRSAVNKHSLTGMICSVCHKRPHWTKTH